MGGLRKYMPITAISFLIGTLAISGIPPFAGFWSKDEILGSAFAANPVLWGVGWLTAGITAFYMFRMYFSTFEGKFRGNKTELRPQLKEVALGSAVRTSFELAPAFGPGAMDTRELAATAATHDSHGHSEYPHESPWTMTLPLMVLAVPSVLIGLVGTPFANYFEAFIHPPSETAVEIAQKASEFDLKRIFDHGGKFRWNCPDRDYAGFADLLEAQS